MNSFSLKNEIIQLQNGQKINFVNSGKGEEIVLLLPGALGTGVSDFKPQLDLESGLNSSGKLKLIAWDPPGYGLSRPPDRTWPLDFFHRDARLAIDSMNAILKDDRRPFSICGWSDGGITAMVIAGLFPQRIKKMVVWGTNSYIAKDDIEMVENVRDVSAWSARMREPMELIYGKDYFPILWNQWVDAYKRIYQEKKGNVCNDLLPEIICPTLIIHGDKDVMVAPEHPDFMHKHIKGSILHRFPEGKHNLHFKYKKEFNELVGNFLIQ